MGSKMNQEHQPQETESAASIGEKRSESFLSAFRGKYLQPFDKGFRSASRSLLVIFVFVFFVRAFVMEATVILTASMEKTKITSREREAERKPFSKG